MKKRRIVNILITVLSGVSAVATIIVYRKMTEKDEGSKKLHELYMAFNRWIQLKQDGISLAEYFHDQHYKTVAIYGMKELGERLYDELTNSNISVAYVIDKNADSIYADVNVVTPDSELDTVDVIVVTAIYYFDEIEEMLSKKVSCPIVSLKDILYEM